MRTVLVSFPGITKHLEVVHHRSKSLNDLNIEEAVPFLRRVEEVAVPSGEFYGFPEDAAAFVIEGNVKRQSDELLQFYGEFPHGVGNLVFVHGLCLGKVETNKGIHRVLRWGVHFLGRESWNRSEVLGERDNSWRPDRRGLLRFLRWSGPWWGSGLRTRRLRSSGLRARRFRGGCSVLGFLCFLGSLRGEVVCYGKNDKDRERDVPVLDEDKKEDKGKDEASASRIRWVVVPPPVIWSPGSPVWPAVVWSPVAHVTTS